MHFSIIRNVFLETFLFKNVEVFKKVAIQHLGNTVIISCLDFTSSLGLPKSVLRLRFISIVFTYSGF